MKLIVEGTNLQGAVNIPGSKSHTIRAVAMAALGHGQSRIESPLESADSRAAFDAYRALGAHIQDNGGVWSVDGIGGRFQIPENVIDVRNSGTTMRIALGSTALLPHGMAVLTGDEQVRRRPCGPLAQALNALGADVRSTRGNGCAPLVVRGLLRGGEATVESVTSQYVTALLINAPLAENATHLHVPVLNEKPYVLMTLDWLRRQGIQCQHSEDLSEFILPGNQNYAPVQRRIPGDFSSATFFLAAGALPDNEVFCTGLDMTDTQGDKAVLDYLRQMGATITIEPEGIRVRAQTLKGCELDLNATPDALPMMAVMGCFARGETRLVNVPQARLKETDRIAVMRQELTKLGARITELPDGLVIEESALQAGEVDGHADHRVVMAMAIAGSMLPGLTTIDTYEAVNVTYPRFLADYTGLGGKARIWDPHLPPEKPDEALPRQ